MQTPPRLGFLGVGWIGLTRMRALVESGAGAISALADPSAEALERAAEFAPGSVRASSLEQLLELRLDGLVIATPSAMHAPQCIAALERGLAVFCQKPLGRNAVETREIVETARRANRLLGVDFSYRHTEAMRRIRQTVLDGTLGRVYAADLVFHNAYGPDKPWFRQRELSGGGCAIDLGIHLVDLAMWVMPSPVVGVSSRLFQAGAPWDGTGVEDYAVARLDFASGAVARIACSWNLHAGCDAVIQAEFHGDQAGAAMRNVNGSFYDFTAELFRGTSREAIATPPDAWGGRAVVEWARRLGAGERFDPEAGEFVEAARVVDGMYFGLRN